MLFNLNFWGSHSGVSDDSILFGRDTVSLGDWFPTFRRILAPSSSRPKLEVCRWLELLTWFLFTRKWRFGRFHKIYLSFSLCLYLYLSICIEQIANCSTSFCKSVCMKVTLEFFDTFHFLWRSDSSNGLFFWGFTQVSLCVSGVIG